MLLKTQGRKLEEGKWPKKIRDFRAWTSEFFGCYRLLKGLLCSGKNWRNSCVIEGKYKDDEVGPNEFEPNPNH